ncbi:MAG: hypothetical protein AAGP08_04425 [Pseudomonadota bacterium]
MERTVGLILFLCLLGACGVDAPPVPPGEENPETIRTLEDINVSGYF